MKVGDFIEYSRNPVHWGIIVAVQGYEYEVYWMDGDRSWIRKKTSGQKNIKKYLTILSNRLCY